MKEIGIFLVGAVAVTFALWISWAGSWMTFKGTIDLDLTLATTFQFSLVLAILICPALWFKKQAGLRTMKSFMSPVFICATCLYASLFILHFIRKVPTRYGFLGRQPMVFSMRSSSPGHIESVYSFRANSDRIIGIASSELTQLGFKFERSHGDFSANQNVTLGDGYKGVYIDIEPGRATGKHFVVDGDMVVRQESRDWVTVDVIEPDLLMGWPRLLVP